MTIYEYHYISIIMTTIFVYHCFFIATWVLVGYSFTFLL